MGYLPFNKNLELNRFLFHTEKEFVTIFLTAVTVICFEAISNTLFDTITEHNKLI